jgi:hypothetical protein
VGIPYNNLGIFVGVLFAIAHFSLSCLQLREQIIVIELIKNIPSKKNYPRIILLWGVSQ